MFPSQKPGIEDEDLLRFLKKSEETFIIPQFEEAIDTGRINNLLLRIGMGGMQCASLTLILWFPLLCLHEFAYVRAQSLWH